MESNREGGTAINLTVDADVIRANNVQQISITPKPIPSCKIPVSLMPNPYFQFKEFTIRHDRCAMKVCTDACILGAWSAQKLTPGSKVLDIGAGSGLLTLMLAQKVKAQYDAIEKDEASYRQMTQNINSSLWGDRINTFWGDVIDFPFPHRYDFVICNPPFYENDLKSGDRRKNIAKHDTGLTLERLINVIDQNLAENGCFSILLPFHRTNEFLQLARTAHFHLKESVWVKQSPRHDFFRNIVFFTRANVAVHTKQELIIKTNEGKYSASFVALLEDYYLYL